MSKEGFYEPMENELSDLREVRPAHVARWLKIFYRRLVFSGGESSRDRVRLLLYNYNANIYQLDWRHLPHGLFC